MESRRQKKSNTKVLWLFGILIHIFMMIFIMDLYFKSPISHGMTPHKMSQKPFAKRLVLFVADGLRAEGIYSPQNEDRVPYLKSLRKNGSAWGIVHTHVPTETRPGHVALLGGMYEDPSAIFSGWRSNLVDVDSIINQSSNAWSYGSPDIVHIFTKQDSEKLHVESYDEADEDFSGKRSTLLLDKWVFDKVTKLLDPDLINNCGNLCEDGNIFFLHLLGMDTVGHVHKPDSEQYVENLKYVDKGIQKMVNTFEEFFKDDKTVFIFASDHGMTNWGSHGDGSDDETQTPFIAWGSGIAKNRNQQDMEQADMAILMASLIGIPIPINAVGILHPDILNGTNLQKAEAMYANVRQLSEQYFALKNTFKHDQFYQEYYKFAKRTGSVETILDIMKRRMNTPEENIKFGTASAKNILESLSYLQNYYFNQKMGCVIAGFFFWILYLALSIQVIRDEETRLHLRLHGPSFYNKVWLKQVKPIIFGFSISILGTCYLYYIGASLMAYLYFIFPIAMFLVICFNPDLIFKLLILKNQCASERMSLTMKVVQFAGLIELLVYGFFHSSVYAGVLAILAVWAFFEAKIIAKRICIEFINLCAILGVYILLPIYTKFDYTGLTIGASIWVIYFIVYIKHAMDEYTYIFNRSHQVFYKYLTAVPLVLMLASVVNTYCVATAFGLFKGVPVYFHMVAWLLSAASLVIIPLFPTGIMSRFGQICACLMVPYILLSAFYDVFFYVVLVATMRVWIIIESHLVKEANYLSYAHYGVRRQPNKSLSLLDEYRKTYFYLALTIASFFATGNFSSINSFDPLWARAFVSTFNPFIMGGLIMFKIITPIFIVACTFQAINTLSNTNMKITFAMIMLFCDQMLLNFIFFIRNEGSWLEIGMSLSHFIIMDIMVLALLLFYALAHFVTTVSIHCFQVKVETFTLNFRIPPDDNISLDEMPAIIGEDGRAQDFQTIRAQAFPSSPVIAAHLSESRIVQRRRVHATSSPRRAQSAEAVVHSPNLFEEALRARLVPDHRRRPFVLRRPVVAPVNAPFDAPLLGTMDELAARGDVVNDLFPIQEEVPAEQPPHRYFGDMPPLDVVPLLGDMPPMEDVRRVVSEGFRNRLNEFDSDSSTSSLGALSTPNLGREGFRPRPAQRHRRRQAYYPRPQNLLILPTNDSELAAHLNALSFESANYPQAGPSTVGLPIQGSSSTGESSSRTSSQQSSQINQAGPRDTDTDDEGELEEVFLRAKNE